MNLLIIGGTKFLGPHVVENALARSHRVTLFNRGNATIPPGVEFVRGDRAHDLDRLANHRFDAVIDTCGFVPGVVRDTMRALRGLTDHFTFISSISVYQEPLGGGFAEAEPVIALPDPSVETITPETYGGLKALCEREVLDAMAGRALIVRPGLIVGPLDPTDRFTYWPNRFALGGQVLAPGSPDAYVSFIDVRDLARWIVRAVEGRLAGVFNASGEHGRTTMRSVIEACAQAAGGGTPVWVDERFLLSAGVIPWSEMPLWIPAGEGALMHASSAKAAAAALEYRPLHETVAATLAWTTNLGLSRALRAGITLEREAELLKAWRERSSARSVYG